MSEITKEDFVLDVYERIAPLQLPEETSKKVVDLVFWALGKGVDLGNSGKQSNRQQSTRMRFDPETGNEKPYPSDAEDWREYHGSRAWLFNPWTGDKRDPGDIGSDVNGLLILPPGESLCAGSPVKGSYRIVMIGPHGERDYVVKILDGGLPCVGGRDVDYAGVFPDTCAKNIAKNIEENWLSPHVSVELEPVEA